MVNNPFEPQNQPNPPEPQQSEHQPEPDTSGPPHSADYEPLNEHTWRSLFNGFEPHNTPSSTEDPSGSEERYLLLPDRSISRWKKDVFNILLIERVGKSNVASFGADPDGIAFWSVPTRCLREDQFVDNPVIQIMAVDEKINVEL